MKAIINTKLVMEDGIIWDGALTYSPPDGDRRVDPPALSGRVPGLPGTRQDEAGQIGRAHV